jgi:two-component system phosphate regulon response regulator OmpR
MKAQAPESYAELPHILVVDDDDRIRELVARYLGEHGFLPVMAADAAQARELLHYMSFDALVLDVMMPKETGIEFLKSLREAGNALPVVMLTALGEIEDRVTGLQSGADDYLPKPFDPRELVLRLQAILRRRLVVIKEAVQNGVRIGSWVYDAQRRILEDGAQSVSLTEVEGNLLNILLQNANQILSREELATLCGLGEGNERTVDVQVTRLRKKIEIDPKMPRHLQTVRGRGYKLLVGDAL